MISKRMFLLATILLAGCDPAIQSGQNAQSDNASGDGGNDAASANASEGVGAAPAKPATAWQYDSKTDQMRGAVSKTAQVDSENTLSLAFPYGETKPTLNIRQDPKFGFDIYITSNGQPLCRSYDNDTISVKFDSGPIQEWRCTEAADGSPGIVFFDNQRALLPKIKAATKMVVEINYYDNGRQQFSFPVKGLDWK